jgi:hypothetical protein
MHSVPLVLIPRGPAIAICGRSTSCTAEVSWQLGEGYSDLEFAILRELGHPPSAIGARVAFEIGVNLACAALGRLMRIAWVGVAITLSG